MVYFQTPPFFARYSVKEAPSNELKKILHELKDKFIWFICAHGKIGFRFLFYFIDSEFLISSLENGVSGWCMWLSFQSERAASTTMHRRLNLSEPLCVPFLSIFFYFRIISIPFLVGCRQQCKSRVTVTSITAFLQPKTH